MCPEGLLIIINYLANENIQLKKKKKRKKISNFIECSLCQVFHMDYYAIWTSLGAQMVKNLPAMQETWVQFLGQGDPLEKEMATHSTILAWRFPWTEEPSELQSMGSLSE